MAKLISASIELTKIDKKKIIDGKNGKKFYNITIHLNDEADQYQHDVAITESLTKEERERGDKKIYIGNGKTIWSNEAQAQAAVTKPESNHFVGNDESDLPF